MPVETLALQLTHASGIEPLLVRLIAAGALPTARLFVLMALVMWVLVLLSFLSTLHLRRVLQRVPAGPHRERLAQSAHVFRRISRITGWAGHALLMIGAVVALLGWWVGAEYPLQALVMSALTDIGVMQPCRTISGLFGRLVDLRTATTTTA